MECGKTFSYQRARVSLLQWEKEPLHFCWRFHFLFFSVFVYPLRAFDSFGYQEAILWFLLLLSIIGFLFRFRYCFRPQHCHETGKTCCVAAVLTYIDAGPLWLPAFRSSPSASTNPSKISFFVYRTWSPGIPWTTAAPLAIFCCLS